MSTTLRPHRRSAILPLFIIALSCGCGKARPTAQSGPPPAKAASEEAAKQFAEKLMAELKKPSLARPDFIDADRLFEHSASGVELSDKHRAELKRQLIKETLSNNGIVGLIRRQLNGGGDYSLLRVRKVGEEMRALFRFVNSAGGINYHEFILIESESGAVLAEDICFYLSGERVSEERRRRFLQVAAQRNRGILSVLRGPDKAFVQNHRKIKRMSQALLKKDYAQCLSLYDELPAELQKTKNVMLIRVSATAMKSKAGMVADYVTAIEDYRSEFPNDASLKLISIDYYLFKQQYQKCLDAIDALDKQVGGDPYLDRIRAPIYVFAGKPKKARAAQQRAAKALPK